VLNVSPNHGSPKNVKFQIGRQSNERVREIVACCFSLSEGRADMG